MAMSEALVALARQRQTELDGEIATWLRNIGTNVRIWCGPGCGNCCSLTVNTTFPEAFAIAAGLDDDQRQRLGGTVTKLTEHTRRSVDARTFLTGYRDAVGPCPLLDAAANCAVYACRPLACRALLATRPHTWCGVNLAKLPAIERDSFLTSLDRNVVAFPTHYAAAPKECAADLERTLISHMIHSHGYGVTGNLPLLVTLAGQPECGEALSGGPVTFHKFLAERHCAQPFLVQIHEP